MVTLCRKRAAALRCRITALSSMHGAGLRVHYSAIENQAIQSRSRTSASRSRTTALSSLCVWFSVLKFRVRRFDNDQTVMRCRPRAVALCRRTPALSSLLLRVGAYFSRGALLIARAAACCGDLPRQLDGTCQKSRAGLLLLRAHRRMSPRRAVVVRPDRDKLESH